MKARLVQTLAQIQQATDANFEDAKNKLATIDAVLGPVNAWIDENREVVEKWVHAGYPETPGMEEIGRKYLELTKTKYQLVHAASGLIEILNRAHDEGRYSHND